MSQETAAQLIICADKYNIQPLITRACKLLIPTSMAELFPALYCVSYVSVPGLLPSVTRWVQRRTDVLVATKEFLELDANCLEFVARQDKLAITELELWKSLVRWVQERADDREKKRQLLEKPLRYMRLATLTQDQIVQEVMSTNILHPEEMIDLLSAVSNGTNLTSPGLCVSTQIRDFCEKDISTQQCKVVKENSVQIKKSLTFKSERYSTNNNYFQERTQDINQSNFTIKTRNHDVDLEYFTCKAIQRSNPLQSHYRLVCTIKFNKFAHGFLSEIETVEVKEAAMYGEDMNIPIKLTSGELVKLKKHSSYDVIVSFQDSHPAYHTGYYYTEFWESKRVDKATTFLERVCPAFKIKFNTPLHVRQIIYKV